MKTSLKYIALAGLTGLFISTATFANDNAPTNAPTVTGVSGWITAPKATFEVQTYKTSAGRLVVQVKNNDRQPLTVTLSNDREGELIRDWVSKRQAGKVFRFDVAELADGDYVVQVSNNTETVTKKVKLVSPPQPARQAVITVGD